MPTAPKMSATTGSRWSGSRNFQWLWGAVVFFLLLNLLAACQDSAPEPLTDYLIRIGDASVSVEDFNKAFEIAKTAYPADIDRNSGELKKVQLRLLHQMTAELLILERGKELGIKVSDAEVHQAEDGIKNEYPKGVFEQMFLENAVSYESWKDQLKTRLLLNKVIARDMEDKIVITPQDVSQYYEKNYRQNPPGSASEVPSDDINEKIIKQLRRQKAEKAFNAWLKGLKERYRIEINSQQWEKITGSRSMQLDAPVSGRPQNGSGASDAG